MIITVAAVIGGARLDSADGGVMGGGAFATGTVAITSGWGVGAVVITSGGAFDAGGTGLATGAGAATFGTADVAGGR
jgi:hypothetical protein